MVVTPPDGAPSLQHERDVGWWLSLGLSATSQQYFSLRTNQPPATSQNQPAVLFSQNKPAPAISHQPTDPAVPKLIAATQCVHSKTV
jgi:hypothetical protein